MISMTHDNINDALLLNVNLTRSIIYSIKMNLKRVKPTEIQVKFNKSFQ